MSRWWYAVVLAAVARLLTAPFAGTLVRLLYPGPAAATTPAACPFPWTGPADGTGRAAYGTFRADFHHFDRTELDLRGNTHVWVAAFSCPRLKLADMVLI